MLLLTLCVFGKAVGLSRGLVGHLFNYQAKQCCRTSINICVGLCVALMNGESYEQVSFLYWFLGFSQTKMPGRLFNNTTNKNMVTIGQSDFSRWLTELTLSSCYEIWMVGSGMDPLLSNVILLQLTTGGCHLYSFTQTQTYTHKVQLCSSSTSHTVIQVTFTSTSGIGGEL